MIVRPVRDAGVAAAAAPGNGFFGKTVGDSNVVSAWPKQVYDELNSDVAEAA